MYESPIRSVLEYVPRSPRKVGCMRLAVYSKLGGDEQSE